MVDDQKVPWLLKRAKASLDNAPDAGDPAVAQVHMELHARYLGRASAACFRQTPGVIA